MVKISAPPGSRQRPNGPARSHASSINSKLSAEISTPAPNAMMAAMTRWLGNEPADRRADQQCGPAEQTQRPAELTEDWKLLRFGCCSVSAMGGSGHSSYRPAALRNAIGGRVVAGMERTDPRGPRRRGRADDPHAPMRSPKLAWKCMKPTTPMKPCAYSATSEVSLLFTTSNYGRYQWFGPGEGRARCAARRGAHCHIGDHTSPTTIFRIAGLFWPSPTSRQVAKHCQGKA